MNVETGTETPIFLFWEYLFRNLGILSLQCSGRSSLWNQPAKLTDDSKGHDEISDYCRDSRLSRLSS
jgi:hypothetical protein